MASFGDGLGWDIECSGTIVRIVFPRSSHLLASFPRETTLIHREKAPMGPLLVASIIPTVAIVLPAQSLGNVGNYVVTTDLIVETSFTSHNIRSRPARTSVPILPEFQVQLFKYLHEKPRNDSPRRWELAPFTDDSAPLASQFRIKHLRIDRNRNLPRRIADVSVTCSGQSLHVVST